MQDLKRSITASTAAEVLAAVGVLLWRIWAVLLTRNPYDWGLILALYWLFSIAAAGRKAWAPVTIAVGAGLLLVYAWGQVPHTLATLGIAP